MSSPMKMRQTTHGTRPWKIGSHLPSHHDVQQYSQPIRTAFLTNLVLSSANTVEHGSTTDLAPEGTRSHADTPVSPFPKPLKVASGFQSIRPVIRKSTTAYNRFVTDWWWWELGSWLLSFLCVAAIVGMILFYQGKKQPQFVIPGITLNAYVAVFSAMAKASMILPISEAIGQLKWMWFRRDRTLSEFTAFDDASRGPWGSLTLLWTTKCRSLASVGAAITVLALGFEPFFQQIVSYPTREIRQDLAYISVASGYDPDDVSNYNIDPRFSQLGLNETSRTSAVVIANAMLRMNNSTFNAPFICPTGKCNWTTYSSLGVCHKCEDVSLTFELEPFCYQEQWSPMPRPGLRGNVRRPCGYQKHGFFFTGTSDYKNRMVTVLTTLVVGTNTTLADPKKPGYIRWKSTAFLDIQNPIIDFYVAFTPGGEPQVRQNATPTVIECMFQWCVKSFEASLDRGRLRENVVAEYVEAPSSAALSSGNGSTEAPLPSTNDMLLFEVHGKSYLVPQRSIQGLGQAIRSNLPSYLTNMDTDRSGEYAGGWNFVKKAPHDINPMLARIATSLTNYIRSESNNSTEQITGVAWSSETFVKTQWLWLILPASLMTGTFLLLAFTILTSQREGIPPWKSSAMATLLCDFPEEARTNFDLSGPPSEIEAVFRTLHVKLSSTADGLKLVSL